MPSWSSLGHAIRRRAGMPMSHHESVGKTVSKGNLTPEQVLASGARSYVGQMTNVANISASPAKGKLMKKKNTQAGDPTAGGKANRKNVLVNNAAASERMGAAYRVTAKYAQSATPEVGPTMANAKTVPSVSGKQSPNFSAGMEGNY